MILFVQDNSGNFIAFGYDNYQNNTVIDENSTALAMILSLPIPWLEITNLTIDALITAIKGHTKFAVLVSYIRNLMINDPTHLMDYNAHPNVLDVIIEIERDITGLGDKNNFKDNSSPNSPNIDDAGCNDPTNVTITNPKKICFGISSYNLNGNPKNSSDYYLFTKIPRIVLSADIWGNSTENIYHTGPGDYLMCFAKPHIHNLKAVWDFYYPSGGQHNIQELEDKIKDMNISAGNYMEVLKLDALIKGTYANILDGTFVIAANAMPIGGSLLFKDAELIYNGDEIRYYVHAVPEDAVDLYKLPEHFIKSKPELLKIFAGAFKWSTVFAKGVLKNIGTILQIPTIIYEWLKACDYYTSDQYAFYKIHKNPSSGNSCVKSPPPLYPNVTYPSIVNYGQPVNIGLSATDPQNKQIQYWVVVNGNWTSPIKYPSSGFVNSGQPVTISYNPIVCGKINFECLAMNSDYSMSGPTRFSVSVLAGGTNFFEGFEPYLVGIFTSTPVWKVGYKLPSQIRIVSGVSNEGNQSAKFIDYDATIGNTFGYYAHMYTNISGNSSSIEFSMRVDNIDDDFGVRTWGTYGNWNTMGYYIVIQGGKIKWVKLGYNLNDPNDFISIQNITPSTWYRIKIVPSWNSSSYNIYIDGVLKVSNATFVGYNRGYPVNSAPIYQGVAFVDTKCRAAYLDNINMNGASLETAKIIINSVDNSALTITNNEK